MMKILCRWVCFTVLLTGVHAHAQDPIPVVEYTAHYGDYGDGVDLTGYVTFDIFLEFPPGNPNPALTTIFSATPDLGPEWILSVDGPCGMFQHDQGGPTVEGVQCFVIPFFPSLEWDSYFTIGNLCKAASDQQLYLVTTEQPTIDAWENLNPPGNFFDGGSNLQLLNTAIFRLPVTDPLILPDANNRIRIGRFTTCGEVCLTYGIQYFPNYTGPGSDFETVLQSECFDHPCQSFPFDTSPSIGSAGCAGEDLQVIVTDGGYGPVTYTLYSGSTIGAGAQVANFPGQESGLTVANLDNGFYYFTMVDDAGCRDTSEVFEVTAPEPLDLLVTLLSDNECFGDNTATADVQCFGGTGDLTLTVNGEGPFACGELLTDLTCGTNVIVLTDENGCSTTEDLEISCPPAITENLETTPLECFGADDGAVTGTISGGTGVITATLLLSGQTVATASAGGNLNVNFQDLGPGDYLLLYEDVNGCGDEFSFSLTEPEELTATASVTSPSCFGQCNGQLVVTALGGEPPLSVNVTAQGGGSANPQALCAGTYNWIVTDGNNCTVSGQAQVVQPAEITTQITLTPESCADACDGVISLSNTAGGAGGYTYSYAPANGICQAPCSGTAAQITNLCAGTYGVTITDQSGCIRQFPGQQIAGPDPVVITLDVDPISCFGAADGAITVTATGGSGSLTLVENGNALPFTEEGLGPGTYGYTVQDENGCTADEDVVLAEPDLLTAVLDEVTDLNCGGDCSGSVSYLVDGGTEPYSYVLVPGNQAGASGGVIGSLCQGQYVLTILDANLCLDTIQFTVQAPDPLFIDLLVNAPTCTGMTDGSALVSVGGGTGELTVVFDPDEYNIEETSPGTYTITDLGETAFSINLYDEADCSLTEEVSVVPDLITDMVISTFSSPETCWNQMDGTATVAVQNGLPPISYEWDDPQQQTTPVATGLASSETYSVTVTDAIGCNLTVEVEVDPTLGCLFISTGITPNGDGSNDEWVIGGLEFFPDAKIQVFNRWGQVVFESTGYSAPWNGTYEGVLLPVADYYFIIDYSEDFEPITGTVTIKY